MYNTSACRKRLVLLPNLSFWQMVLRQLESLSASAQTSGLWREQVMASACLFLAGKVDETPKPLRDVVKVAYILKHKNERSAEDLANEVDERVRCQPNFTEDVACRVSIPRLAPRWGPESFDTLVFSRPGNRGPALPPLAGCLRAGEGGYSICRATPAQRYRFRGEPFSAEAVPTDQEICSLLVVFAPLQTLAHSHATAASPTAFGDCAFPCIGALC